MHHEETAVRSRITIRRQGRSPIEIRPEDFQAGDVICESNGLPLRDARNRKPKEKDKS